MPHIVVGRNESDTKTFGTQGTLFVGKHLVGTGEETHMATPVLLDALRPHVITITGKRGSGKSFSLGIIAEELFKLDESIRKNICVILIDTQGIFWTMKSPNDEGAVQLERWGLKPRSFPVTVYVPEGQAKTYAEAGVDFDSMFSFLPSEVSVEDWLRVFSIKETSTLGLLLQKAFTRLGQTYDLSDIRDAIRHEEALDVEFFKKDRTTLENYLSVAQTWGIFGESNAPELLVPGKISVIDVSLTPQHVRSLLVSLLLKQIFFERTQSRRQEELATMEARYIKQTPIPWIFMDEAHNFIPREGETPSSDILKKIVKEGRQPGISIVFATQQPAVLHEDVLAQTDMIISHRLTSRSDIEALRNIMQTYMLFDIEQYINELPKQPGAAIILDDNSERIYKVQVRPRHSWHAGSSPIAVRKVL